MNTAVRILQSVADVLASANIPDTVIESHSESTPSLRLSNPFPSLQAWADSLDYDALDPTDHAHIPFAIILIKEGDQWRKEASRSIFSTYARRSSSTVRYSTVGPCPKLTSNRRLSRPRSWLSGRR